MPKKKPTHAEALAVYHASSEDDRIRFEQTLLTDPRSLVSQILSHATEHHSAVTEHLEKQAEPSRGPDSIQDCQLVLDLRDNKKWKWSRIAERMKRSEKAVQALYRRTKKRLASNAYVVQSVHRLGYGFNRTLFPISCGVILDRVDCLTVNGDTAKEHCTCLPHTPLATWRSASGYSPGSWSERSLAGFFLSLRESAAIASSRRATGRPSSGPCALLAIWPPARR
jgi:hypothetical protein